MSERYGGLKLKKRPSFVKKASQLERKYSNTDKGKFIKETLYTEYRTRIRNRKNRALKLLQENDVELEDAPDWVEKIGTIINTADYTILGGGIKDIILWKPFAYTFYIVPNEEDPETNWKSPNQYRYEKHLTKLAEIFEKLHPKVKARLNYAKKDDIYATTFQMKQTGIHGGHIDRRLVITRVPLCDQGTLIDYIVRWGKTLGVEAFATMVYETMKVLRILHDNSVYVLDIKPQNIFVCNDPRKKGYDKFTFSFGDLDMAEICDNKFDKKVGYKACQSDLATLYFLPTNAIENPNKQRNLYGHQGYTIRDAYALSKTLLVTFNLMFGNPEDIALFTENELFDWDQPQTIMEQKEWAKDEDLKKATQTRRYVQYMTQGMSNYGWEYKMKDTKEKLLKLAKDKAPKLTFVIDALFTLMYQTSNSGRPVETKDKYTPLRLKNWDEMVDIDRIHDLMKIVKDRANTAGAKTFKRKKGWFGFSELEEEEVTQVQLKF